MRAASHIQEAARLEALRAYGVLDTPSEADFDEIVALAAQICGTPISLVSFVAEDRQWFKAKVGLEATETPLGSSICAHAILGDELFEIADTREDARTRDNPLVMGDPRLQFYAGVPLKTDAGLPLGTLCVLDTEPRELTEAQKNALRVLGHQVMTQLELRRKVQELELERTAREQADLNSKEDRDFIRLITDRLPMRVAYVDRELRYRFVNDAYERELGLTAEALIGLTVEEVMGEEAFTIGRPGLQRALRGETLTEEMEVPYLQGQRTVRTSFVPDFEGPGRVRGVVIQILDITEQKRAERAIADVRAKADQTLDTAEVAVWRWNIAENRVYASQRLQSFFNASDTDAEGGPVEAFLAAIHDEDKPQVSDALTESIMSGRRYEVEYRVTGAGGRERWVLARGNAEMGPDGKAHALSGIVLDVTERVAAQQALRASEEQRRLALESARVGAWNIDLATLTLSTDALFRQIFSGANDPIDFEAAFLRIHDEDRQTVRDRVAAACLPVDPVPYMLEYRVVHVDGSVHWVFAQGRANFLGEGAEGVPISFDGTVLDITARRQIEEERERLLAELAAEREKLQTMFDQAPAFVAVLRGPDLVFEYVNAAYYQLVGHRTVIGLPLALAMPEVVGGGEGRDYDRVLRSVMESGEKLTYRERPVFLQRTPGEPLVEAFVDLSYQPLREADGSVSGVLTHGVDVTDKVAARFEVQQLAEQLARQTALWDSALSSISDLVYVFDREARFRYVNRALLELWGVPAESALGKTCEELAYPPQVAEMVRRDVERVFTEGIRVRNETDYTSPTGVSGYFEHLFSPIFGPDGSVEAVAGSSRNFAERNAAIEALRASEERFRQLIDLSPSTVWFAEPDGGLSFISQDFYDATGMTPETALPSGWASAVHPEDLGRVADAWAAARVTETIYDIEFRIRHRSGDYRWITARALPLRDVDGAVTGWLGSNSDVQSQKEMEDALRLRVEERTADLVNAVKEAEAFNYSISHDLRSPLRAMSATSSILLEEAGKELSEEHREMLVRQNENAIRLGRLIDELLRLSRLARVEVKRQPLDMSRKARTVFGDLDALEKTNGCQIEVQEGMKADGDPGLVRTVFENLIGNACKFSPQGGTIRVAEKDGVFSVADEGVGFSMAFAPKVFIPFERLVADTEFEGTGIGLANVERIVRRHGGRVWVESAPGKGATFFFTLGSS